MRKNVFERRPLLMCHKLEEVLSGGHTAMFERFVAKRVKVKDVMGNRRLHKKT